MATTALSERTIVLLDEAIRTGGSQKVSAAVASWLIDSGLAPSKASRLALEQETQRDVFDTIFST